MSSTKITNTLPSGGPYMRARRFSILPSNVSCVWLADVAAENAMAIGWNLEGMRAKYCCALTVLPVPVSPVKRTWRVWRTS